MSAAATDGGSIPFNGSVAQAFQPTPERLGLLSVTQAMADYAMLIQSVRDAHGCPDCPVLSFGGSYSGKLSAYMRLKYPTVVDIAHAASAPIKLGEPHTQAGSWLFAVGCWLRLSKVVVGPQTPWGWSTRCASTRP